jgi:VIT1/CCC1 family predicted Fe2+/Mn2+ transporter
MNQLALITTFATISGESLVNNLVCIIVAGLIFWLLFWLIGYVGMPEPFNKIAKALLAVAAVIFLIYFLLSLVTGRSFITW